MPSNENNVFHLVKNIYSTLGLFAFYRGFGAYALATGLWHYVVPKAANQRFYYNLLKDNNEDKGFLDLNIFEEEEEEN